MEEKRYTIVLEDGTIIKNLRLNGNCFVSQDMIDVAIFDGNLGTVVISDGEKEETHENMVYVPIPQIDEEFWFLLRDIPKSEIEQAKIRSDIDYLAMMTRIDI